MAKLEREDSIRKLSDLPPLPSFSQGNCGSFNSFAIPLVRRQFPALFSNVLVGVVPASKKPTKKPSITKFNYKTQRKLKK